MDNYNFQYSWIVLLSFKMIPSGPRTLGGTSFRQVVKAGKCGYRMAIFFVECKCRFRRPIGCKTRNPHAAGGGKDSARGTAEFGGAALMAEYSVIARAVGRSIYSAWGHPFGRGFSRRSLRRPTARERPRVYTVLPCDFPSRSSDSAGILCR